MSRIVIDFEDGSGVNVAKLAEAVERWGTQQKKTTRELLIAVIDVLVGNGLVDEELEENMLASLAQHFGVRAKNFQSPFNAGE